MAYIFYLQAEMKALQDKHASLSDNSKNVIYFRENNALSCKRKFNMEAKFTETNIVNQIFIK